MTSGAGGENIAIVITAEDRASRKVKAVGDSLRKNLGTSLRSAALSMLSFTAVLSGVGLSITAVIVVAKKFVGEIIKTNRASALLGLQFRAMGFDADRANASITRLRNNLNRTSVQALANADRHLKLFVESLTDVSQVNLDQLAEKMDKAFDQNREKAFLALAEAASGFMKPLNDLLGTDFEDFKEAQAFIEEGFLNWLQLRTPLERFSTWVSDRFKEGIRTSLEDLNDLLGGTNVFEIRNMDEAIQEWKDAGNLLIGALHAIFIGPGGDLVAADIKKMFSKATDIASWLMGKGEMVAFGFVSGLRWLFSGASVSKVETWLKVAISRAAAINSWLEERGKLIATSVIDGIRTGISSGLDIAKWISDALRLPDLFQAGVGLARGLAQGILDGLRTFLQRALDFAVDRVNDLIGILNRLPRTNIGRVRGIRVPQAPDLSRQGVGGSRPAHIQGAGPQPFGFNFTSQAQPVNLKVDDRVLARFTMRVINGQLRVLQPGVGIN